MTFTSNSSSTQTAANSRTPRSFQQAACHSIIKQYQSLISTEAGALVRICRSAGKNCRAVVLVADARRRRKARIASLVTDKLGVF